jgi:hypothetical protein
MKQNLFEEVGRMYELLGEQQNLVSTVVKIKPMAFAIKYKDDFIDYFNRIALAVNREDFCENVNAISQQSVNSLKTLIKNISTNEKITEQQLIDFVLSQLTSGLAKSLIDIALKSIPADNTVPKEILDAVKNYLKSAYEGQGIKLVGAIDNMINNLKQPVQYFCQGSSMQDMSDAQSDYGELRQATPQKIQSKEAPKLQTNAPKPKLNTQGALAQQMAAQKQTTEKNKPLQNAANKVKDVASNIANKVRDKIKNRGGQGPANT